MAAKKKGPGRGKGPSTRPASPAKRVTIPKGQPPAAPTKAAPPAAAARPPAGTAGPSAANAGEPTPATPPSGAAPAAKNEPAATSAPRAKSAPRATPGGPAKATASGGVKEGEPAASATNAERPAKAGGRSQAARTGGAKASPTVAKSAPTVAKSAAGGAKAAPGAKGKPSREERLAAAQAARRRRALRNRALLAGGVAAVVALVAFVIVSDRRERNRQASRFQTESCEFDRRSDADGGPGRNHVPNPTYDVDPPAGGDHLPSASQPGIYTTENLPPDGGVVHALEHGYIVLWYRPDLDEPALTGLRDLAQRHTGEVLMVPRASMDVPVAATSWHARLLCGALEPDTVDRFIAEFVDKGPEKGFVSQTRQGP